MPAYDVDLTAQYENIPDGGQQTPPGDGGQQNPPGDGGQQTPPGDGGQQTPSPGDGGQQTPPPGGNAGDKQATPDTGEPQEPAAAAVKSLRKQIAGAYYLKKGTSLTPVVLADMADGAVKKAAAAKLTWKSSKTKVATVGAKTGKIKAKRTGSATITGTSPDGKKKVVIKVKVVAKAKRLTKVKVKGIPKTLAAPKALSFAGALSVSDTLSLPGVPGTSTNLDLAASKSTAQLKVVPTPTNATNLTISYKSSNSKVLKVDACGKLTPVKKGKAKITITVKAGGVKEMIKTKTIQIK
jgi:hypothetical protein